MRKIVPFILVLFACSTVLSQTKPSGLPALDTRPYVEHRGYYINDSGIFFSRRPPNWTPKQPGATTYDNGIVYYYNGSAWVQLSGIGGSIDIVATISALQSYAGTSTTVIVTDAIRGGTFNKSNTGTVDNGITFSASGGGYWVRDISQARAINVLWFGARADWNGTTGTDLNTSLQLALTYAGDDQQILIPSGDYYSTSIQLPYNKKWNIVCDGNIHFKTNGGIVIGDPAGSLNYDYRSILSINGTLYGNNESVISDSTTFASLTGAGITIANTFHAKVYANMIWGFQNAIIVEGTNGHGSQYNNITFQRFRYNYRGIYLTTTGTPSWANQNNFYGGQINGFKGIESIKGSSQTDPFNGNQFFEIGFENLTYGLQLTFANNNSIIGGRLESGSVTHKINLDASTCYANQFHGLHLRESYFETVGLGTMISGNVLSADGQVIGNSAISDGTKFTFIGTTYNAPLYTNTTGNIISLGNTDVPERNFAKARIGGNTSTVRYSDVYDYYTASADGDYTMPLNIGYEKVMTNGHAVNLVLQTSDIYQPKKFIVESAGGGTITVKKQDGTTLLNSTYITSSSRWLLNYADGILQIDRLTGTLPVYGDINTSALSGLARGIRELPNLTASADNDILIGTENFPVFNDAGYISVQHWGERFRSRVWVSSQDNDTALLRIYPNDNSYPAILNLRTGDGYNSNISRNMFYIGGRAGSRDLGLPTTAIFKYATGTGTGSTSSSLTLSAGIYSGSYPTDNVTPYVNSTKDILKFSLDDGVGTYNYAAKYSWNFSGSWDALTLATKGYADSLFAIYTGASGSYVTTNTTQTISAAKTLSVNSNDAWTFTGTHTTTANNQRFVYANPATTLRGTASDIFYTYELSPTLTAGANNQTTGVLKISPTFSNGAFTGVNNFWIDLTGNGKINGENQIILARNGTNVFTATSAVTNISTTASNIPLKFSLNGSEISEFSPTNGNLLINTTTDNATDKLQVSGSASFSSSLTVNNGSGLNILSGVTSGTYRTTNGASNLTAHDLFDLAGAGNTAGNITIAFDQSFANGAIMFLQGNGTRKIRGAYITPTSLTSTAGSEAMGIDFGTQSGGTTASSKMTLSPSGNLTVGTANNIVGTATNNNATAGNIGEYVSSLIAVGSAVSLTTATAANITSISLTAGDWDVTGMVNFNETTSTVTARSAGITSTSATVPSDGSEGYCGVQSTITSEKNAITISRVRFSLSGTTTVYLVGSATFSAGTCTGFGNLTARRVR